MKKIAIFIMILIISIAKSYGQGQIHRPAKRNADKQTVVGKVNKPQIFKPKQQNRPIQSENADKQKAKLKPDYNGHDYVDLGLPSGLKWATCNVGATVPEGYGNYYAWGEINSKSSYDWSNCFDCKDSNGSSWDVYKHGGKTQLSPTSGHDTARENWGGTWRMPTATEMEELCFMCNWKWTTLGGHKGYLITGHSGNSIFLPAAGFWRETECIIAQNPYFGFYWSSSLSSLDSDHACILLIESNDDHHGWCVTQFKRKSGACIRPVIE